MSFRTFVADETNWCIFSTLPKCCRVANQLHAHITPRLVLLGQTDFGTQPIIVSEIIIVFLPQCDKFVNLKFVQIHV